MHLSGAGLELMKRAEGFRSRTYTDIAGRETIGFGHMLLPAESYPNGINVTQAEAILAADVGEAEEAVSRLVKVPLTQGQFDALVDFVFNLGSGRLATSTLLKDLNGGRYDAAAWQLLAWDHVGTQEVAGLKARREAEFHLWSDAALQRAFAA
jgi:lysozyme